MSILDTPLLKDDFTQSQWESAISECQDKQCHSYSTRFFTKARELQESGNVKAQAVFTLLGAITSLILMLNPDSREQPFAPMAVFHNSRSAILDDISDAHLDVLIELVPEISDAELRARVADILWVRKHNYQMAQFAIDSYLESAARLENPENWTWCFERIERAIFLARQSNQPNYFKKVVAHIEAVLDRYNGEDPLFLSAKLMELLQEYKQGEPAKYIILAEKAALSAESEHNWHKARSYWEVKTRWHRLDKDAEQEQKSWLSLAETYVSEAEDALRRTPPSYMVVSSHIEKAIEAFRKTGGTRERVEELHKRLLEYQKTARKELVSFSYETDISKVVEIAREKVKGKNVRDALFTLALMGSSPKIEYLLERVGELFREYPLQFLMSMKIMNEMGKVVERRPSIMSNNPEETEAATQAEMFRYAVFYQKLQADACVEPVRYQITLEHYVRVDDFLPIVFNSPFVPPGREYIYARGLYAGLIGDFLSAAHFLIPQIENSIRYLLSQQGVLTSGFNAQGIQNEDSLNELLDKPETKTILGEDILFDLKGLLVERCGSNLRNRMAHGLIGYEEFLSSQISYLWWLTLRLCCLPILSQMQTNSAEASEISENGQGDASTPTSQS